VVSGDPFVLERERMRRGRMWSDAEKEE